MRNVVKEVLLIELSENLKKAISEDEKKKKKGREDLTKEIKKATKSFEKKVKDAADIAIFGRMVAADPSLTKEGAGLFSHALSTHAVKSEVDYFSAVEELNEAEESGAGHIDTMEFNSACYYRYIGLNLDLLRSESHMAHYEKEEYLSILRSFLKSCLMAVPEARKNSMNGSTLPTFVLGLRRRGHPLSLANAFEHPISAVHDGGYTSPSIEALQNHWNNMKNTWGISFDKEITMPESNFETMISGLTEGIE
jgi:CRISPR system Cascade subunit CasC